MLDGTQEVQTSGSPPLGAPVSIDPIQPPMPTEQSEKQNGNGQQSEFSTTGNGKNFIVPQHAFKKAKDDAREKGRKEAIDSIVKELGLSSVDEFKGLIQGVKSGKVKAQPPRQEVQKVDSDKSKPESNKEASQLFKERSKWQKTYESQNQRLSQESRARKDLEQRLEAKDAEMALMAAAFTAGIRDDVSVEVAIRMLTKHVESLSEQDQAKFDERKYFSSLRESHPVLFSEVVRPATTGNGSSNVNAPKPGTLTQTAAVLGKKDARKMNPQEYREHLLSQGLKLNI
jgi:hypothetical protein